MKILVVTRGYPQKHNKMLGLFEKDQALALKAAGLEVAYAVVDIRSVRRKRKFGFNHFFDENGLEVFEMNWPIGPMPRSLIEYFRQEALMHLYPYVIETFGRPDIIHAHFLNYGVISVKLAKEKNIPLVITEHSSYLNTDKHSRKIIKRVDKAYSGSDAIISVSDSLNRIIKDKLGYDSIVINNIAGVKIDISEKVKHPVREGFSFATAGNLIKGKGFDILIDAFVEVVKKYPNTSLTIYGDGPLRKRLIDQVKSKNLDNNIDFYGSYKKDEIDVLFCSADAFVLASRAETFGVVYIEAMSSGLPVIATKCGGPEDFINNKNGYLVDKEDSVQLSDAMVRMIENIDDFDRKYIKQFVEKNFSPKVIATKIKKVYDHIL